MEKSLFSLVKYNAGQFKSDKQRAYILSRMNDGEHVVSSSVTFGEYVQQTTKNTRSILWSFYADEGGIYLVTKNNSVWWIYNNNAVKTVSKRLESRKLAKLAGIFANQEKRLEAIRKRHMDTIIGLSTDKLTEWAEKIKRIDSVLDTIQSKRTSVLNQFDNLGA